jgi:plastocyanin
MRVRRLVACTLVAATSGVAVFAVPAGAGRIQPMGAMLINYVPQNVHISAGDTIRFVNTDPTSGNGHSFSEVVPEGTPPKFDSRITPPGTFTDVEDVANLQPGEYAFHCKNHEVMHGKLTVDPPRGTPVAREVRLGRPSS